LQVQPYTSDCIIVSELIKEITVVAIYKIWLMDDQSEISRVRKPKSHEANQLCR